VHETYSTWPNKITSISLGWIYEQWDETLAVAIMIIHNHHLIEASSPVSVNGVTPAPARGSDLAFFNRRSLAYLKQQAKTHGFSRG